jgi:hypothetical protein
MLEDSNSLLKTKIKYSQAEIEHLITRFRTQTLPISEWTHEAHLLVAIWFTQNYALAEAVCYLRSGIITYNYSVGTENSPQKGYHETLTLFWARVANYFVKNNPTESLETLANQFIQSELASRELPLQYYSREVLFSTTARAFWVEPDLQKLDF